MLYPSLSLALFLFLYSVRGCYTRFCQTDEEKNVVEAILEKIPPLPWPQSFHSVRNYVDGEADIGKLTELQKQNPLLGDEWINGGYFELALRNLPLNEEYSHMKNKNSDWERRLLLRVMLCRRPISFSTENGELVNTLNIFESYIHISAIELEIELLLKHQFCRALLNVQLRIMAYAAFRSSIAQNMFSLQAPEKYSLVEQSLEVMELSKPSNNIRAESSNIWFAAVLWKHLNTILQSAKNKKWKTVLHFLLAPISVENCSVDRALYDRLCRLNRVSSKLPHDVFLIFLEYCNFVAQMLPFRDAPLRPRIDGMLKNFWSR